MFIKYTENNYIQIKDKTNKIVTVPENSVEPDKDVSAYNLVSCIYFN